MQGRHQGYTGLLPLIGELSVRRQAVLLGLIVCAQRYECDSLSGDWAEVTMPISPALALEHLRGARCDGLPIEFDITQEGYVIRY